MRDWLPEDHLAWFVLDVVAELDLSEFYASYRPDGRGGESLDDGFAGLRRVGSDSSRAGGTACTPSATSTRQC